MGDQACGYDEARALLTHLSGALVDISLMCA